MQDNNISVRAYSKRPRRKFLGLPLFGWVVLMVAGFAAAQLVSMLITAPQTVQGVNIQFKTGTTPPATVPINVNVTTTLQAQGVGGFTGAVKLRMAIGSSSALDTCASLKAIIAATANPTFNAGLPQIRTSGPNSWVNDDPANGANGVLGYAGGCTLQVLAIPTYTVTASMADSFDARWAWTGFPNGSLTFVFGYEQ